MRGLRGNWGGKKSEERKAESLQGTLGTRTGEREADGLVILAASRHEGRKEGKGQRPMRMKRKRGSPVRVVSRKGKDE